MSTPAAANDGEKTPDELRRELSAALYKLAFVCAVVDIDPAVDRKEFEAAVAERFAKKPKA